uniref:Uncharacterized protein LOC114348618 n=1 Tax=Diabrotica virgifera virgifera TaxID=50390 RepID=A0A6P7H022_DIAVI
MPRHCCVPGCKTNYASTLKTKQAESTFSFPKDPQRRYTWLRSIHREGYIISKSSVYASKITSECVYFYLLNINQLGQEFNNISVISSVIVSSNFSVIVNVGNNRLSSHDLKWILQDSKLTRWSQLENLLSRYTSAFEITNKKFEYYIQKSGENIQGAIDSCDEYKKQIDTLKLISNKLKNMSQHRKQYSIESLLFALDLYNKSPTAYDCLREYLFLPSKRHLQQISTTMFISPDNDT